MVEIFATSALINGLFAIIFGTLVFFRGNKDKQHFLYFFLTISFAAWSLSYWQWLNSSDYNQAFFWTNVLAVSSLYIPIFFFHWNVELSKDFNKLRKFVIIVSYISVIVLSLFFSSQYLITDLEQKLFFKFWPNPGFLYTFYIFFIYLILAVYAVVVILKQYVKSKSVIIKGRSFYLLLSAVFGYGGGATNFLLWYDVYFPPYGNFVVGFFPFFFGYAMIKHKMFNVKTVATEILVLFIVSVLFIQVVLSNSILEFTLRALFFVFVTLLGVLLIRSVYKEVHQREKIENLAKDLEKANEKLRELDQLKTEFLSLATHQIRSPLTSMRGYVSMVLEGDYGKISEEVREPLVTVQHSTEGLSKIVNDFLNVSRMEQGRMQYDFEEKNLVDVVKNMVDQYRPNVEEKGLKLKLEIEGENHNVSIDENKFEQVVGNIIDNSIKYTLEGSITVRVSSPDSKKVRLEVSDTGVGISKEEIPKLFVKFKRAEGAQKVSVTGSGLGMYLAKKITESHSGKIWIESEGEGKGSNFIVELPVFDKNSVIKK